MSRHVSQESVTHIGGALQCSCCLFTSLGGELPGFCSKACPLHGVTCHCDKTHLYGCYESDRWGGRYIYYCPLGLIFIAASLGQAGAHFQSYLVAGPVLMNDPEDIDLDLGHLPAESLPPRMSTGRVNHIAEVLTMLAGYLAGEDALQRADADRELLNLHNLLYDLSQEMRQSEESIYPIAYERELMQLIARGDKSGSQELLNRLLGHIYFASGAEFEVIKARVTELIVLLSRACIEGGADIDKVFWHNNGYMKEVQHFHSLAELSEWLTRIMHRFVSYVFDFGEVKHVDVMYKVLAYIRQHLSEKITLEDVAGEVYLSKSYLSKIFKEEMGCTFTNYVNTMRVDKSKQLLLTEGIDILDIAMLVGFDDQSYFTKVFKKLVGVSPGRFRENRGIIKQDGGEH